MLLSEFLSRPDNPHSRQGNPRVKCNALSKTSKSVNIQVTPSEAIEFARHLLEKAQLILDNDITDAAVQIWNVGEKSESVSFGLIQARKGAGRKKRTPKPARMQSGDGHASMGRR